MSCGMIAGWEFSPRPYVGAGCHSGSGGECGDGDGIARGRAISFGGKTGPEGYGRGDGCEIAYAGSGRGVEVPDCDVPGFGACLFGWTPIGDNSLNM